jgi:uncharacterized protein (UPF0332 family)
MLDEKRVKEAESNIRLYLSDGLLKKVTENESLIKLFIKNAKESLEIANKIYNEEISDLWTIVCSYYSMYYLSNAILLKLGYKVGDKISHKVVADALITYVRKKLKDSLIEEYEDAKDEALNLAGIKADSIVESFDFEREKRGRLQYKTLEVEKRSKAKTSLDRAKNFASEINKLLIN